MLFLVTLALAAVLSAAGPDRPMTAGEFLARAEPLLKKNKVSLMFSSEAKALVKILGETAQRNRERLDADRAAGKTVTTCLPPKGKAKVEAGELLAYLRSLQPAQRNLPFDRAFASFTARKYPCPR